MTSFRSFVVAQSTLAQGNTVREHLENPLEGGTGTGEPSIIYIGDPVFTLDGYANVQIKDRVYTIVVE